MSGEVQNIGFNLLYLVPGQIGGMETYARELIPEIAARCPDKNFTAFVNREGYRHFSQSPLAPSVKLVEIGVSGRSRVARTVAEHSLLPRACRRHSLDLLHSMGTTSPFKLKAKSVVTVHDLIYKHYPSAHSRVFSLGMRLLVPVSTKSADRVIADSKAGAEDLIRTGGVKPQKIDVVHLGIGTLSRAQPLPEDELRRKLGLGSAQVVLTLSAKRKHKNLLRLIEAFAALDLDSEPILVLPGYATDHEKELKQLVADLEISDRVKFFGWLDDATIEGLYQAATCFAFPSLLEGFGLPVLEAMARGLPVASSNSPPLPEIGGEAAIYFDPTNTAAITQSIESLLTDSDQRRKLALAGKEQAAKFSWTKAAELTVAVYRRAFEGQIK